MCSKRASNRAKSKPRERVEWARCAMVVQLGVVEVAIFFVRFFSLRFVMSVLQ